MICQLADAVLDDILRVHLRIIASRISQGIADEASPLDALQFIDQAEDCRGQMTPVGDDFDAHAIHQINTFDRTFIFIFTAFMEARHRVVEMRRVGEASLVCRLDFIIFRFGMGEGNHYALRAHIAGEVMTTLQLGADVPTLDTSICFFDERLILCRIDSLCLIGEKFASHLGIQVRPFDV